MDQRCFDDSGDMMYAGGAHRVVKQGIGTGLLLIAIGTAIVSAQTRSQTDPVLEARSLVASHQLQKANELLSEAVAEAPQNVAAWLALGDVQTEQKLYEDAMRSFETVLKVQPASKAAQTGEVHAAISNALSYRGAGDQDGALRCLLQAKKYVPDSPELLMDFGIQADSMQIYRDADAALTKAHALAPTNPQILYALAHVEVDEQKAPAAEANLKSYLKMKPEDATAHYGLGHLLHMMARNDEAETEFRRSIALQPRQTESYYELGEIALDRHQDATARDEYEKVLATAPTHGGALTGMGIVALRARDNTLAEKYLSQAIVYAPDYVPARRFYAMALARQGRQEESRREMAIAEDLSKQQNKLSHGYVLEEVP